MKLSIPDHILSIKPYTPGKPLEELEREYGIDDSIKLASNENPIGPSPLAVAAIKESTKKLNHDILGSLDKPIVPDHCGFPLANPHSGQGLISCLNRILTTY